MYFILTMGIFQPAMLVYQRVMPLDDHPKVQGGTSKKTGGIPICLFDSEIQGYLVLGGSSQFDPVVRAIPPFFFPMKRPFARKHSHNLPTYRRRTITHRDY